MITLVTTVHIAVCFILVIIVLLQHGKGADAGATFGGGNQAIMGSSGRATPLSKITTGAAVIFMLSSLALAYLSAQKSTETVFDGPEAKTVAPAEVGEPATQGSQNAEGTTSNGQ